MRSTLITMVFVHFSLIHQENFESRPGPGIKRRSSLIWSWMGIKTISLQRLSRVYQRHLSKRKGASLDSYEQVFLDNLKNARKLPKNCSCTSFQRTDSKTLLKTAGRLCLRVTGYTYSAEVLNVSMTARKLGVPATSHCLAQTHRRCS